jgi:hypothetical protein
VNDYDRAVIENMERHGGGFVKALAECCRRADPLNFDILKLAFPDYWRDYDPAKWSRSRPEGT